MLGEFDGWTMYNSPENVKHKPTYPVCNSSTETINKDVENNIIKCLLYIGV